VPVKLLPSGAATPSTSNWQADGPRSSFTRAASAMLNTPVSGSTVPLAVAAPPGTCAPSVVPVCVKRTGTPPTFQSPVRSTGPAHVWETRTAPPPTSQSPVRPPPAPAGTTIPKSTQPTPPAPQGAGTTRVDIAAPPDRTPPVCTQTLSGLWYSRPATPASHFF